MKPALIVHGGAWKIPADLWEPHLFGCRRAVETGWRLLETGASAVDAVVEAVRILEDDPTFDAGIGSVLNRDGYCELDAAIMDGDNLGFGAVAAVRRYANPIDIALRVLRDGRHCLLAGEGAEAFAAECGLKPIDPRSLIIRRELDLWRQRRQRGFKLASEFEPGDTVGAAAFDRTGRLACANSTGGTGFKLAGRIGDSCLPGCGLYAEKEKAAVCCTGWGEQIMRRALAKEIIDGLKGSDEVESVVNGCLTRLSEMPYGLGGVIGVTAEGRLFHLHNTPRMAWAAGNEEGIYTAFYSD